MARFTRRSFATAGVFTAALLGQQRRGEITSASVPEDPDAPRVSEGTLSESLPFGPNVEFHRADVTPKVKPFAMTEVRVLPSVFKPAEEANRRFILTQNPDRLLHVFRVNAGIASSAPPLGGWEKPDCELRGHFVGHYLSACALMSASTGDQEFKKRGDYIVSELAKCQAHLSGGYLSAFPTEYFDRLNARKKVWAPFYTVHKIMAGLLDMHQIAGNSEALNVLTGMAAWTDKYTGNMTDDHRQMVLDTEYGGMGETLYNLTALTGDTHFAEVGDRFIKRRFFNPLAMRRDELRGLHVNTHIPQVIGAARRYEISGDHRFRDVADYFWQSVVQTRTYVTGGTSNNEGWLVGPNQLAAELKLGEATNECCCSYNMLKLTRKLYEWTADPRFFDYYERALLNHRLGTIDGEGHSQYYLGVVPGSWRAFGTDYDSFWCCTGTGIEEYSKLNDSIYFHDADGLYVNLFIASELNWSAKRLRVTQRTAFPEQAGTQLQIDPEAPVRFALRIRVPAWVAGSANVSINGKPAEVSAAPGSYLTINRIWSKGDRVEIGLPMRLWQERMADDSSLSAILFGPLVLAGKLGNAGLTKELQSGPEGAQLSKAPPIAIPQFSVENKKLDEWMAPGSAPLNFRTIGQKTDVEFAPFYKVNGERYSVYWRTV